MTAVRQLGRSKYFFCSFIGSTGSPSSCCATDSFAVSFTVNTYFDAPRGRSRMYLENAAAADASQLAEQFGFEDPQTRVVFLTTIHDTRFDNFSVLRPISNAE